MMDYNQALVRRHRTHLYSTKDKNSKATKGTSYDEHWSIILTVIRINFVKQNHSFRLSLIL